MAVENEFICNEVNEQFSHSEFIALALNTVSEIVKDPLLKDLHSEPSVEEVNSQIALEHGKAITVNVLQQNEENNVLPVVVPLKAKVKDLKKAIQRHLTLKQTREGGTTYISWRHVWRTYWLVHDGEKLTDNEKTIKEYGIKNKAVVTFGKRLRRK
ncbi:U11/U12 small nuclear ribonucleoprotein 25 kDa protein-like [Dendronephthya gigantea]|uniref:U11/U12 small nuclear ribonucleoprotein 25 kDa protein-like n=1 Tax=Dendronephthya gigantea TaxID=151771 RepID=UPI00106AFA47|nr:U11/U12 small nuclear ribonucleoprotein 25 kDa protein-like [Dendronephthya gigantea]